MSLRSTPDFHPTEGEIKRLADELEINLAEIFSSAAGVRALRAQAHSGCGKDLIWRDRASNSSEQIRRRLSAGPAGRWSFTTIGG